MTEVDDGARSLVTTGWDARLQRFSDWVERWQTPLLLVLLCGLLLSKIGDTSHIPFWYDEVVDLGVARLPHLADLWNFYAQGLDVTGFVSPLLIRAGLLLPLDPEVAARLPFVLCFLAMMWAVFTFVRRSFPAVYAFSVMPLLAGIFLIEIGALAKAYSTEWALLGLGMVCWQAAARGRGRPWTLLGLWFALAGAMNAHKFGVFYVLPFGVAELVRVRQTRRSDWPLWLAILLAPLALLPTLPGDRRAAKFYGANFWSRPHLGEIYHAYKGLIGERWLYLVLVVALLILALLRRQQTASPEPGNGIAGSPPGRRCGFSASEWALVGAICLLPLLVFPFGMALHALRIVYVEVFAVGTWIVLVAAFATAVRGDRRLGALLFLGFALLTFPRQMLPWPSGMKALLHPRSVHARVTAEYRSRPWMRLLEQSDLPVLAGDQVVYATTHLYATPALDQRLSYPLAPALLHRYPAAGTAFQNFHLFGPVLGYRSVDFPAFAAEHRHFLMILGSDGAMWLPPWLLEQARTGHARVALLGPGFDASFDTPSICDVTLDDVAVAASSTP